MDLPKDTKWLEFAEEPVREHFDMQLFSGCRAPPGVGRVFSLRLEFGPDRPAAVRFRERRQ